MAAIAARESGGKVAAWMLHCHCKQLCIHRYNENMKAAYVTIMQIKCHLQLHSSQ